MAVLAVLMLTMIMVETLAKPVPGDWNHEMNFDQDTHHHPELQFHQNTGSEDFRQIQHKHLQQVGQNMQQGGHNQEFDFEQDQNEQQDIEQVGHQQVGHQQEFEDSEQHQNEQDIEQVGHQQEFEDSEQHQNEQQDIEQVGHQQVGHQQEFEDSEQHQNEQDIEQVGHQQVGHEQEFEDSEQQGIKQVGHELVGHHWVGHDQQYLWQQDNQWPVVEPRQHYEKPDTAHVSTEKPGWWKKLGHKISDTFNKAKNKANYIANKIKETVG